MTRAGSWSVGTACLALALFAPGGVRAEACGTGGRDAGFVLERLWPMSCAEDVPRDAPVVVDGALPRLRSAVDATALRVRVVDALGADVPGELVIANDGGAARFVPAAPLAAESAYRAIAARVDASGAVVEELRHDFTTGRGMLPAISVRTPDVTSYGVQLTRAACNYDACGPVSCDEVETTGDYERISVHVPPITGGLPEVQGDAYERPYEVTAVARDERGRVLASARISQLRGEHGGILLDVPRQNVAVRACVEVTIGDASDASLELAAQCLDIQGQTAALSQGAPEAHAPLEGDMGQGAGCSIGARASASWWWSAGLFALLVRRRRAR